MRVHLSRLGSRRAPEPESGDEVAPAARSHRRIAAREVEPAQEGSHLLLSRCVLSQEPRPPCTTTGLRQATLRPSASLCRRAGPGRTEIAAWDARELASYLLESWRPGVPLPRCLNRSAEPTSRHARGAIPRACDPLRCHGRACPGHPERGT